MKIASFIFLSVILLVGCSHLTTSSGPRFDIHSADVVAAVVKPSTRPDHEAEIVLVLTEDCGKRYEPFGKKYARQNINLFANGRLLLRGLEAPEHLWPSFTAYIFTSLKDANTLADSLIKK